MLVGRQRMLLLGIICVLICSLLSKCVYNSDNLTGLEQKEEPETSEQKAEPEEFAYPELYEININEIDTYIESSYDLDRTRLRTDFRYKMFYGKWKATEILVHSRRFPLESEDVIGNYYFFSDYRSMTYYNNKYTVFDYPQYEIRIIPFTPEEHYFSDLLPSLSDMGIEGSYFTIINLGRPYPSPLPCSIVLVDDSTMIMHYDENGGSAYVKLERLEYVRNYKADYSAL